MAILINICFKCILLGIKRKPTAAISANLVDVTAVSFFFVFFALKDTV